MRGDAASEGIAQDFPQYARNRGRCGRRRHRPIPPLIDTHGWEKIRDLLAVFQEGSTYDDALRRVYGFDMGALDQEWRQHIGTE